MSAVTSPAPGSCPRETRCDSPSLGLVGPSGFLRQVVVNSDHLKCNQVECELWLRPALLATTSLKTCGDITVVVFKTLLSPEVRRPEQKDMCSPWETERRQRQPWVQTCCTISHFYDVSALTAPILSLHNCKVGRM